MEPRELDALVAEKVMGLTVIRIPFVPASVRITADTVFDHEAAAQWRKAYPRAMTPPLLRPYSISISAAWEVVEALTKEFRRVEVHVLNPNNDFGGACCLIEQGDNAVNESYAADAQAATPALAICLAALKAKRLL